MFRLSLNGSLLAIMRMSKDEIKLYESEGFTVEFIG